MTTTSVFPYPGGKSYLAPWIVDHFPQHRCYVDVFGGSGATIVNKPKSDIEVYNDLDGDLVHFFETLRNHREELVEWFDDVVYARELHEKWADEFYAGERPDDDIERAGRFFYLRYSQYAGKYRTKSGFRSGSDRDFAWQLKGAAEELNAFSERFQRVQVENEDFEYVIDRFDRDETLFYCDPPYVDEGDALYSHGEFDHERFVESVTGIDGTFVISYTDVPPELDSYHTVARERAQKMSDGVEKVTERSTEHLVMNFDPEEEPRFAGAQQTQLGV